MKFFEDTQIGETSGVGQHTFTAEDIKSFAARFDPQPFHLDEEAAARSHFKKLCASGWHTVCVRMRLLVESKRREDEQSLARGEPVGTLGPSPGFRDLKWLKPVRPGDTISARRTTLESRASKSRPDIGIVNNLWEVFNQDGEMVMSMQGYGMFRRRNPGSSTT